MAGILIITYGISKFSIIHFRDNLSIYLLFEKAIIVIQRNNIVKIKCPKCKQNAELTPDFSFVTCTECDFDMTYGEYVKFVAHNEANYSKREHDSS